jgi:DNA polymerase-3 subunit chi
MTRVDFYILGDQDAQSRWSFACRLVEKVLGQQHQVYLHTENRDQALYVDNLLWSFKPESFIPHDLGIERLTAKPATLHIGYGETAPDHHHDVLINVSQHIPTFFSRFERVAEIVSQDDDTRALMRQHYTFYKERGYLLHNHDLRPQS